MYRNDTILISNVFWYKEFVEQSDNLIIRIL